MREKQQAIEAAMRAEFDEAEFIQELRPGLLGSTSWELNHPVFSYLDVETWNEKGYHVTLRRHHPRKDPTEFIMQGTPEEVARATSALTFLESNL